MASFTYKDAHAILKLIGDQALGKAQTKPVDTTGFIALGNKVLETGTENVMNAISVVVGEMFVAVRPFEEKLTLFNTMNHGLFTARIRKISYYMDDVEASGFFNTDINPNNIKNGADNTAGDGRVGTMWEQKTPDPVEINFYSNNTWDNHLTLYEGQLKAAFRNEASFIKFWQGVWTTKENENKLAQESYRRMQLLDFIGSRIAVAKKYPELSSMAINLTKEFNDKYGTTYTSADLRTNHRKEFFEFLVWRIKDICTKMRDHSMYFHNPLKDGDKVIVRQTPKDMQRLMLFEPLISESKTMIFPELFNEQYLKMEDYEGVSYWQHNSTDNNECALVSVKGQTKSDKYVNEAYSIAKVYVVGALFDKDALMTTYGMDASYSTPVEARHGYRNLWWHILRGAINDCTENGVIFYMEDAA